MSSSPDVDSAHKVTVKRVEGGRMSAWLIDNVKAGNTIRVRPPDGRFMLNRGAKNDAPLTLLGGGSGITPLISLMKSALATTERSVKLIYANRDRDAIIFKKELDALQSVYPHRVEIHYHLDSESHYLTVEKVRVLLAGREAGDHYVCGPAAFMDIVERALEAAGIAADRTRFERFVSPIDPDRQTEKAAAAIDASQVPKSFALRLGGKTHIVPYQPGLTLLAAAQRSGVKPPSSCEDGFCGSCMAQLIRGSVTMKTHQALTEKAVEKGRILLCQALPTSGDDLELDYDATSFSVQRASKSSAGQLASRVIAAILVVLVLTTLLLLRSRS